MTGDWPGRTVNVNKPKIVVSRFLMSKALQLLRRVKRAVLPGLDLSRHARLMAARKRLFRAAKANYADNVLGHRMYLDSQDSLALSRNGVYEPLTTAYFQSALQEGQVVLDIGANIGYYTLLFARQVGPQGHVYAFEPEPTNYALLCQNVVLNGYRNVTLINGAVANRTGRLSLFISQSNQGDHRLYDSHDGRERIEVRSMRLDDTFADSDHQKIDFVKMDIQGAEHHAVEGMMSLLHRNPQVILVTEFWPAGLARAGVEPAAFLERLLDLGFRFHLLEGGGPSPVRVDGQQLLAAYTVKNGRSTNLVCNREGEE